MYRNTESVFKLKMNQKYLYFCQKLLLSYKKMQQEKTSPSHKGWTKMSRPIAAIHNTRGAFNRETNGQCQPTCVCFPSENLVLKCSQKLYMSNVLGLKISKKVRSHGTRKKTILFGRYYFNHLVTENNYTIW